jgi:hypothetical protein
MDLLPVEYLFIGIIILGGIANIYLYFDLKKDKRGTH